MSRANDDATTGLAKILDPVAQCFTPEVAKRVAELRADPAVQARIEELADKCNEGAITPEEMADLADRRERLGLSMAELRAVHGRVFAAMLTQAIEDTAVTDAEWLQLKRLHGCLGQLGWAPGL